MNFDTVKIIVEVVGALAAAFVLVSYLFTNQKKLRIINLVASIVFVAYGFALLATTKWVNGWVTVILNAACAIVHVVYLVRNKKSSKTALDSAIDKQRKDNNDDDHLS